MSRMSDSEIRLIVLESKEFSYAAGEKLRDELTNEEASLLGYYLFCEPASDRFSSFAKETLYPLLKEVLDSESENYRNKHNLNNEIDDCSAFKNHREENPELYK